MTKIEYLFIMHCFVSAFLWLVLMCRYFYYGNKYEKLLRDKYPRIASERSKDPFYPITWKAFPVFFSDASELILKDRQVIEYRKKALCSLLFASAVIVVFSIVEIVIK